MRDPDATPLTPVLRAYLGMAALVAELLPIVALDGDQLVGFEVLVRGERGGPFADPLALRDSIAAIGATAALDEWRWREAMRLVRRRNPQHEARAAQLEVPGYVPVYVPLHPDSMRALGQVGDMPEVAPAGSLLPVLDVPASDLRFRAPDMARAVDRAREAGLPVLVSDIEDESILPMVGVLGADVLRLAPSMVRVEDMDLASRRAAEVATMMVRPPPVLLASGIDDDLLRHRAAAFGVDAASGAAMRPAASGAAMRPAGGGGHAAPVSLTFDGRRSAPLTSTSVFAPVAHGREPLRATKAELVALSIELEQVIVDGSGRSMLVGAFQRAGYFTPGTARRWARLARGCTLAVAAAEGMPPDPAAGVTGLPLRPDDPILGEWHVAALSPGRAALLSARDLGDAGPEVQRRFDYVLSYDRGLVAVACRGILGRIPGFVDR